MAFLFPQCLKLLCLFTVTITVIATGSANAQVLTDASGFEVSLSDHPKRIVTLMPALGELAADFAGKEVNRIVGVSEFTDFPETLAKVNRVGSYQKINFEEIVALKPDLVLVTLDGNGKDPIQHLRELGLPVIVVATDSFAKIEESMRLVGAAMGDSSAGKQMAEKFRDGLKRIQDRAKKRNEGRSVKKILIEVSSEPLIVAGRYSFLNDAIQTVGAKNSYGDLQAAYPRPSLEDVVSRNPDVIVIFGLSIPESQIQKMTEDWKRFPSLHAVQNREIQVLRNDSIVRPSLRLLEGLNLLEKAIYEKK